MSAAWGQGLSVLFTALCPAPAQMTSIHYTLSIHLQREWLKSVHDASINAASMFFIFKECAMFLTHQTDNKNSRTSTWASVASSLPHPVPSQFFNLRQNFDLSLPSLILLVSVHCSGLPRPFLNIHSVIQHISSLIYPCSIYQFVKHACYVTMYLKIKCQKGQAHCMVL